LEAQQQLVDAELRWVVSLLLAQGGALPRKAAPVEKWITAADMVVPGAMTASPVLLAAAAGPAGQNGTAVGAAVCRQSPTGQARRTLKKTFTRSIPP